ncbi:hypothetical protein [Massilia endophytica]|uniref:hypothetical protein n=1 Tax=Massilia endophytica TaxID=2899220 RepID=UPI001E3B51D3|nr:hypothetical protein [Massilia endophytica]UGQ45905.1 hypothetical protein LSQ66_19270 [Massilia endophytica]
MLKRLIFLVCSPLLALTILSLTPVTASAQKLEFCWKSTYGRGVGTIPVGCAGGRNKEVGMCYTPCKPGYDGAVTMCLRQCPSGYVNTGFTCHIDKPLLVGAKVDVCNFSSSCPSGYTNVGLLCGLNTPPVPPGYKPAVVGPAGSGLDLSREVYDRGIGLAPSVCSDGKENNAGLCYPKCKPNYSGIGPVCWGTCPSGWTDCGMGCATSASKCGSVAISQVVSVGSSVVKVAGLIATAGLSGSSTAANSAEATKLQQLINEMKEAVARHKEMIDTALRAADAGYTTNQATDQLIRAVTPEEIAQATLRLAALLDPSGLTGVAAQFTYPTCDKVQTQ